MLEQFTEDARRTLTIAAMEAGSLGSSSIETAHLLLALTLEDMKLLNRFLDREFTEKDFRNRILERVTARKRISAVSVQDSFSDESRQVLSFAEEEASVMGCEQVGAEHLLLGFLRKEDCLAAQLLNEHGARLDSARHALTEIPHSPVPKEQRIRELTKKMDEMLAARPTRSSPDEFAEMVAADRFALYSEGGRRAIFYARYEATNLGSIMVETEHLLLGVLREERARSGLYLSSGGTWETIRAEIEEQLSKRETAPMNAALPLSDECERALAYAEEEAGKLGHERIVPAHLLLGLLREEDSFGAQLLRERGAEIERIRRGLASRSPQLPPNPEDPSLPSSS